MLFRGDFVDGAVTGKQGGSDGILYCTIAKERLQKPHFTYIGKYPSHYPLKDRNMQQNRWYHKAFIA